MSAADGVRGYARRRRRAAPRRARERRSAQWRRLSRLAHDARAREAPRAPLDPPAPPIELTPAVASDPATPPEVLWHIARHAPHLRKWVVVNRAADANLLEFIAQRGGPGVRETLTILLDVLERGRGRDADGADYFRDSVA